MDHFEICRITGAANSKTWAQVHLFEPKEELKREAYGTLFAVFSLETREKLEEELEITAFGKEVLTRFHELYYSAGERVSCQERLERAFEVIKEEFFQKVKVSGVAAIAIEAREKRALYVTRLGKAQADLWRGNQKVILLPGSDEERISSVSGWLEAGDTFVLGTASLFALIPQGSFQAALSLDSLDQASQVLAPIVHGHKENALAAMVMARGDPEEKEIAPGSGFEKEEKEGFFRKIGLKEKLGRFFPKGLRNQESLTVKLRQKMATGKRSEKMAISVAVVFLILLVVSVGFGFKKKQDVTENRQEAKVLEMAAYNLDQAEQLKELNPIRSRSLLEEAKEALESFKKDNPEIQSQTIKEAEEKIDQFLAKVSREYQIEETEIFFDLNLIKEGFKAKSWGLTDEEIVILGQDGVATLEFNKKQTEVIAGGDEASSADFIGSVSSWAILGTDKELAVVDKNKQKVIDRQKLEEVKITDLVGYAGNAYVLDQESNQVYRYAGLSDGLAKGKEYIKGEPDLGGTVSMAIDGSVWIMFSEGDIVKYTGGKQDAFAIAGLTKPFLSPTKIFTDENQDNLYILDYKNTRVVVLGKGGEYRAQYIWPGIAGVIDLAASEKLGKILLLTESKVYSIEIKNF